MFKLKGKGILHINGRGRGDQYVRMTIEVPKNLSQKQKQLLQESDSCAEEKNYQKRKGFFDKIKEMFDEKNNLKNGAGCKILSRFCCVKKLT